MKKKKAKKTNRGKFIKDEYVKWIDFNKAVLWKTQELSIPVWVYIGIKANNTKTLRFYDPEKKEAWLFDAKDVIKHAVLKQEGQEKQFYFSIDLRKDK